LLKEREKGCEDEEEDVTKYWTMLKKRDVIGI